MTEEIKQRIETIKAGKVPDGYKRTVVGIVPNEWEEKRLKQVCFDSGTYGINAPACDYNEKLPVYLRITDIDDNGRFISKNKVSVSDKCANNYILNENDLVFARTGATTGKTYLYNSIDGELVYAGFLIKFSINPSSANPYLVKQFCNSNYYWKWVSVMSARSGQPGINANEYSKYKFAMPNDINEQNRIAEILSKWDKAIELQEKLIKKLELQKKALMQRLLTPKEGWKKVKIGTLTRELSIRNYQNECINVKSVSNKDGFINQEEQFSKRVASKDTSNYKKVSYGNIAYNPSRINVGSIAIYEDKEDGIVSPMYVVFECKKINPHLLLLLLNTDKTQYDIKSYLSGSVRDSLNYSDLEKIEIFIPDERAQSLLFDFFNKKDLLYTKEKEKLKLLKQQQKAMQQLLLTGIVRV